MHLIQHFILSWFVAEGGCCRSREDRRLITWSGCLPDVDVIPYAGAIAYNLFFDELPYTQAVQKAHNVVHLAVHHKYTHGLPFALLTALVVWWICRRQRPTADRAPPVLVGLLSMCTVLLHSFCDLIATHWPIYPFWPFAGTEWRLSWAPSLLEWPNTVMLILLVIATRQYALWKRRSPLETISTGLEQRFFKAYPTQPDRPS